MKMGSEMYRMKKEETQDLEIRALGKISPKTAEKLLQAVESVHRTGKTKDGRGIIIQFSMCHFHDIALISWRKTISV